jgi:ABC-2 type transport system permease protein
LAVQHRVYRYSYWFLVFRQNGYGKAFVLPFLIAGVFLVAIGAGLFFTNKPRIEQFQKEYRQDPGTFVRQEIQRTAESQKQLKLVFRILPLLVIVAALIILLLPDSTQWKAVGIIVIATIAFLMVVDSNTNYRNTTYHSQLSNFKP